MTTITREMFPGGGVRLSSGDATFQLARPRPSALLVTISGIDRGQFGQSTLDEIRVAPVASPWVGMTNG